MNITNIITLVEAVSPQYHYHMTSVDHGLDIMKQGAIEAQSDWSNLRTKEKVICLTRDKTLFFTLNYRNAEIAIQFRINTNNLKHTHKLVPFSFFGVHHDDEERRLSKWYNGGFYRPNQWDKFSDYFNNQGHTNPLLNRMESEEFTNKDIPINNKYITEIQIFITTDVDELYTNYMLECKIIMDIKYFAERASINCNLYDSHTGRGVSDTYWDVITRYGKK